MTDFDIAREGLNDTLQAIARGGLGHPLVGDTRLCPQRDCGRPQHYTGAELGWCHDALTATWDCADPRKAGA